MFLCLPEMRCGYGFTVEALLRWPDAVLAEPAEAGWANIKSLAPWVQTTPARGKFMRK